MRVEHLVFDSLVLLLSLREQVHKLAALAQLICHVVLGLKADHPRSASQRKVFLLYKLKLTVDVQAAGSIRQRKLVEDPRLNRRIYLVFDSV